MTTTLYRVSFVFCTLLALSHSAPPSKLVQIACQRNPTLSFCDAAPPAAAETNATEDAVASEESHEASETKVVKVNSSTSNEREDEEKSSAKQAKTTEGFMLDEDTNRGSTPENTTREILTLKTFEETVIEEIGVTTAAPFHIPDDPILAEPLPQRENNDSEKEKSSSEFGSLLRLPRPPKKDELEQPAAQAKGSDLLVVPPPLPDEAPATPATPPEKNGTVIVFVSRYCVDNRERFVRKCKGEITMGEVDFCKGYPLACQATNNVIPIITYCQRYYKHYDKHCARQAPTGQILDFCHAFDQFCLPETADEDDPGTANPSLKRCEDVQAQARKVCNPFPPKSDQFNVLRCEQFMKHCKKFVDWR